MLQSHPIPHILLAFLQNMLYSGGIIKSSSLHLRMYVHTCCVVLPCLLPADIIFITVLVCGGLFVSFFQTPKHQMPFNPVFTQHCCLKLKGCFFLSNKWRQLETIITTIYDWLMAVLYFTLPLLRILFTVVSIEFKFKSCFKNVSAISVSLASFIFLLRSMGNFFFSFFFYSCLIVKFYQIFNEILIKIMSCPILSSKCGSYVWNCMPGVLFFSFIIMPLMMICFGFFFF